jgi:hypothetical protein
MNLNLISLSFLINKTRVFSITFTVLIGTLLFACRPEEIANNKLHGDWSLQSINNNPLKQGEYEILHFEKDNTGGDIVLTMHMDGKDTIYRGKYDLLKSSTLTFAFPTNKPTGYIYQTEVFGIVDLSEKTMILNSEKTQNKLVFLKK